MAAPSQSPRVKNTKNSGASAPASAKPGTIQKYPTTSKARLASNPVANNERTTCNPDECPKYCDASTGPSVSNAKHPRALLKRFFDIPTDNPGSFVYELLRKSYCKNLSPNPSKYFWEEFGTRQYASAVKGLCGCTAIFGASQKGAFSSHIWEEDKNTKEDLQPKNYKNTMSVLDSKLSPHKDDLKGGEIYIVLPRNPAKGKNDQPLYKQEIVDAIKKDR